MTDQYRTRRLAGRLDVLLEALRKLLMLRPRLAQPVRHDEPGVRRRP